MTVQPTVKHKYKFIEWIDLDNNGVLTECAIMQKFRNGDIYFFPIASLDDIDKRRLAHIIQGKNAVLYNELWNLLEQVTLGNGINALIYFNQLVKVRTASGQILPFGAGRMGSGVVVMQQAQPTTVGQPLDTPPPAAPSRVSKSAV